jgi:hypothetical protein
MPKGEDLLAEASILAVVVCLVRFIGIDWANTISVFVGLATFYDPCSFFFLLFFCKYCFR